MHFIHACNAQKACWFLLSTEQCVLCFMCVIFKLFCIFHSEIHFNKTNIKTKCLDNNCTVRDMLMK